MSLDLNTLKPGMLIEAEVAIVGKPNRSVRVRIDRTPWPSGERGTILSDGRSVESVLTDTIRVIAEDTPDGADCCRAAHPDDTTPCSGPLDAVTVLDGHNAGTTGCEHHAARLLASLKGGRVYSGSVPEAAIRVFKAAADLPPFARARDGRAGERPVTRLRIVDTEQRTQIVLARLQSIFTTVSASGPRPSHSQPGLVAVDVLAEL
ncbi:hypothetical protein [Streptacidiphilus sp. EB103A]|uniref:hypothetical protein n=1 Tax=Streptacidiphilus sp. EB103A TaxID=3156275 RepID=UPI0035116311